jgi:hypothetical protein
MEASRYSGTWLNIYQNTSRHTVILTVTAITIPYLTTIRALTATRRWMKLAANLLYVNVYSSYTENKVTRTEQQPAGSTDTGSLNHDLAGHQLLESNDVRMYV